MADLGERSGGSWWPTIVLWGTVIAVGALYLMSVQRYLQDAPGDVAQAQHAVSDPGAAATTAEAPIVDVPVVDAVAIEVVEVEVVPLIGVTEVPASGLGASSARVADHAPEPQVAAPTSIPEVASREATPAVAPAVAPVAEAKVLAAQVSPLEARAIAGAVTEAVPANQTQAVAAPAAQPALASDQAQGAAAQERARVLAEYEALRRAAQAELDRRSSAGRPWPPNSWSQGQVPWYPNPSYGQPGAGQRYAPSQPRW